MHACPEVGCSYWKKGQCQGNGFTVALAVSLVLHIMVWRFGPNLIEMLGRDFFNSGAQKRGLGQSNQHDCERIYQQILFVSIGHFSKGKLNFPF